MVNGGGEGRRARRAGLVGGCGLAALLLASCTGFGERAGGPIAAPPAQAESEGPPRYASYDCGTLGALTVENFQTSALVVPPDGPSAELPARPAGQGRRFGAAGQSLALEDGRAVLTRDGQAPLVCQG